MQKGSDQFTEKDTEEYYDSFGDVYELVWNEQIHTGYFQVPNLNLQDAVVKMDEHIAEITQLQQGSYLLNIGCGRGGTDRLLAKKFDIKVEGIDISERQIEIAKKKASIEGLESLCRYTIGSATHIEFPDNTFDYILVQEAFFHIHDKQKAIEEFHRVLKNDGSVIIEDTVLLNESKKDFVLSAFGERVKINSMLSPDEHIELFKNSHFTLKSSEDVSSHLSLTYGKICEYIEMNREEIEKKVPEQYKERVKNNFGFDVSKKMVDEGILGCVILVFQKE